MELDQDHTACLERFMSLRISTSVAGVKEEKSGGRDGGDGKCGLLVLDGVKAR